MLSRLRARIGGWAPLSLFLCWSLATPATFGKDRGAEATSDPLATSRLEGQVTDAGGATRAAVKVVLTPLSHPETRLQAISDAKGKFTFERLVYGLYSIDLLDGDRAYPGNRILDLQPKRKQEANFQLSSFTAEDLALGISAGTPVATLEARPASGVARLQERVGPSGWEWFRTGKGVAVLVASGAAIVAGLIAISDKSSYSTTPGNTPNNQ